MVGFTELVADNPLLSARLLGAAGFAGAVVGGIMLFILLVVLVSYIVNSIQQIQEEFKEDLLNWAATNRFASQLPSDNCNSVPALEAVKTVGWTECDYRCRTINPPSTPIIRYMPSEIGCPTPVPCAPGLPSTDSRVKVIRIMWRDKIDPSDLMCTGLY
jgi:hypothetical protein